MRRGPGPARRAELRAGSAPRGDAAGAAQRRVGSDLPGAGDGRRAAPTSSSSSSSPAWRRPRLLAAGGRRERQEAGRPPAKAPPGRDRPGQRPEPRAPSAPRGRRARPAPPRGVIGSAPRQSGRARAAGSGGGAGAALRLRPGRACQAEGLRPPVPPASLSFVRSSVRPFVRPAVRRDTGRGMPRQRGLAPPGTENSAPSAGELPGGQRWFEAGCDADINGLLLTKDWPTLILRSVSTLRSSYLKRGIVADSEILTSHQVKGPLPNS
ncbi:uncharacterized protein LOC143693944 isoform X3 [Agelaius phoeniceus]|uniref:uncharacterized protein LOC143693944 isoform X3 n=1 Tax=Agelaius phoeniceus TaxID=39638 RepID=UPI004054D2E9